MAALLLVLGACSDRGDSVTSPTPGLPAPQPLLVQSVVCQADLKASTVRCGNGELPSSARGYILVGGQGVYTQLTSSNVSIGGGVFSFDVTVQNLIPQAMGTTDGTTADPAGVRVLFASGPTTTGGTGNVTVGNADGSTAYTAPNQPYFQYSGGLNGADGILSTNETSGAKNWQLNYDPGVTNFSFVLYVATEVQFPNGYIDVTPATSNVLMGNTQPLTATVRSAVGTVIPGQTITWGTTDGAVLTVDGSGVATGAGVGSASITATSGARSGSATLGVCPNLAVGGAYTAVMPLASSLCFGGGAGAQEFTYMPLNLSTSSALSLTLTGTGIQAVTGPPSPDRIPTGLSGLRQPSEDLSIASDVPILERDAARFSSLLRTRAASMRRADGLSNIVTPNVVPSVGDLMDLNTNSACSGSPSVRTGQVRSVSQHLIIVGDTANPGGGFTTAQYDSIALEFDSIAWPVDSANFGAPTDLDNNGHVVAFFTRAVNELSPPASSSVVLGFFAPKDVFGTDDCSNSNGQATVGAELFYMLVPDPAGAVNSNVRTVSFVRGNTTGTLGHEFQHMINGMRRAYVTGASFFETGFLNEGLSHVAEELMFYRASGMTPRSNVGPGTNATSGVQLNSKRVTAYNSYESQNIGRFRSWLQRPDTSGALKNNANSLAVRGAIWAFLRYSADRVNGNDQTFWFNLVNSNLEGIPNIQNAIGGASPTDWERDFTAALYADDNAFSVAAQYTNPSWNFRALYALLFGTYSLLPRPLTNNTGLTLSYSSGGGTAYGRFGVPASGFAKVTALSGGVAPVSPYALIVVRTK
jgi:hypothetical protein